MLRLEIRNLNLDKKDLQKPISICMGILWFNRQIGWGRFLSSMISLTVYCNFSDINVMFVKKSQETHGYHCLIKLFLAERSMQKAIVYDASLLTVTFISPWKEALCFIWSNLKLFDLRICRAKCGWNPPSRRSLNIVDVFRCFDMVEILKRWFKEFDIVF